MVDKSKSTSNNGGGEGRNEDEIEDNNHTTAKNSFVSRMEGGSGSIVGKSVAGQGKTGGKDQGSLARTSAIRLEKQQLEKTLRDSDHPTRVGQTDSSSSMARAKFFTPPVVPLHDLGSAKFAEDTLSLVGQEAQKEKELMDVSSPIKPVPQPATVSKFELGPLSTNTSQAQTHL